MVVVHRLPVLVSALALALPCTLALPPSDTCPEGACSRAPSPGVLRDPRPRGKGGAVGTNWPAVEAAGRLLNRRDHVETQPSSTCTGGQSPTKVPPPPDVQAPAGADPPATEPERSDDDLVRRIQDVSIKLLTRRHMGKTLETILRSAAPKKKQAVENYMDKYEREERERDVFNAETIARIDKEVAFYQDVVKEQEARKRDEEALIAQNVDLQAQKISRAKKMLIYYAAKRWTKINKREAEPRADIERLERVRQVIKNGDFYWKRDHAQKTAGIIVKILVGWGVTAKDDTPISPAWLDDQRGSNVDMHLYMYPRAVLQTSS